jgi:hypothetical protein
MVRIGATCLLVLSCGGCIDYAALSSGFVGCPPQFITVDNIETHLGTRAWEATCMKTKYQCSWASGSTAACTEMKWNGGRN